jgi:hypothetical protein
LFKIPENVGRGVVSVYCTVETPTPALLALMLSLITHPLHIRLEGVERPPNHVLLPDPLAILENCADFGAGALA